MHIELFYDISWKSVLGSWEYCLHFVYCSTQWLSAFLNFKNYAIKWWGKHFERGRADVLDTEHGQNEPTTQGDSGAVRTEKQREGNCLFYSSNLLFSFLCFS